MKLIILDRDGVINRDSEQYIKNPDEWQPIAGSLEAIARFTQAGYHVVVATNQSGLGQRLFDMTALNAMHDKMHKAVSQLGGRIDAVFFCPHAQDAGCACRKPLPGMLLEIAARFDVVLEGAEHLLQAPGYLVLRFVLRRPSNRVKYDSAATALAGVVVWFAVVAGAVLVWRLL